MAYKKIKLIIDGYTPNTLPIAKLADYLKNFAALVGTEADIHFEKVGKGSAALVNRVRDDIVMQTRSRIAAAERGEAPPDAIRGLIGLKELYRLDETTGRIKEDRHRLLEFPKSKTVQYGTIVEEGTLEGIVIRIGGKDETAHVTIQDGGKTYSCVTNTAKAKELRDYLFEYEKPVRFFGRGKWTRTASGDWELIEFKLRDYEPLNNDELLQVLDRMRQIPGSGWGKVDDPLGRLDEIRKGLSKVQ